MAYQAATQPQFKASFSPTSTTPLLLPIPAFPSTGDLVGDFTGDFTVALSIADTGKVHQVAGHAGEVGQVIPFDVDAPGNGNVVVYLLGLFEVVGGVVGELKGAAVGSAQT